MLWLILSDCITVYHKIIGFILSFFPYVVILVNSCILMPSNGASSYRSMGYAYYIIKKLFVLRFEFSLKVWDLCSRISPLTRLTELSWLMNSFSRSYMHESFIQETKCTIEQLFSQIQLKCVSSYGRIISGASNYFKLTRPSDSKGQLGRKNDHRYSGNEKERPRDSWQKPYSAFLVTEQIHIAYNG